MARSELKPEDLVAIVDSREQLPLELSLKTQRGTLQTGDYSVLGLQHLIAVERKSLPDLVMCVGVERERFEKNIQRLLAYPTRALVVEASWSAIELGQYRSQVTPNAIIGSLMSWVAMGVPVLFCPTRENAATMVSKLLYVAARKRYRELQSFYETLKLAT